MFLWRSSRQKAQVDDPVASGRTTVFSLKPRDWRTRLQERLLTDSLRAPEQRALGRSSRARGNHRGEENPAPYQPKGLALHANRQAVLTH